MDQPFTLQNLYVVVTDNRHEKYRGVYHHNNMLYQLTTRGSTFNAVRDSLRSQLTDRVGMDLEEALPITAEHVIQSPGLYVEDIFRVTNGVRVTPRYDDTLVFIAPGDGYSNEEILSMADYDFPVTIGAKHRPKDMGKALEAFTEEISKGTLSVQLAESLLEVEAVTRAETAFKLPDCDSDPLADQAAKYPAYWKGLPKHWVAIDTYRIDVLFPLNDSRLTHARKKLLVPGTRTGGKSFRKDILEAYTTLGQWLQDNPEV